MQVRSIGQQWWWEYRYDVDDDGKSDDIVTANDLVIPAGKPVALTITSRDVIHSFWIPALNGKRDAVPGRMHPLELEADEPGVFRGPVHRVLRPVPRLHADARRGPLRGRLRRVAGEPARGRPGPRRRAGQGGHGAVPHDLPGCHLARGPGGNEDSENGIEGAELVSGAAPNLTHFASRGVFAGAVFDLWVDATAA